MKCPKCGKDVEKDWEYCPKCGFRFRDSEFFRFDDIFERVQKQMDQMSKMFERDFEVFDLSPVFREKPVNRKAKGFRITMGSGTGREPKISVQTFGDEKDELKKEILEQLGMDKGMEKPIKPEKSERKRFRIPKLIKPKEEAAEIKERKELPMPKFTEEPKTNIRRLDSKVVVDIEIPGVKSQENVDVRELENSVEVKALAGDKAYFKILTKPSQFRLTSKSFERGKLHLEFT
ncbi:MAG: zinc-ribbon domain-containing protein [Candidatus Aenigmarchaeota archaeon]|nr:zinc-ribbon domain-containing protein [Candidatus Aenigmarchaeota archaeon]